MRISSTMSPSPLSYPVAARVERFMIGAEDLERAPFTPGDAYFTGMTRTIKTSPATGRALRKPRVEQIRGTPPGTIGFLDWNRSGPDGIYVRYMSIRRDLRGKGLGRKLVHRFYDEVVLPLGAAEVDWGDVMSDAAWRLYMEARERFPQIHHHAKLR